jgi:hypothetical protein
LVVCRKPWTLYDVDLVGALVVAALLIAGGWLTAARWKDTWSEYQRLAHARAVAEAKLQEDVQEIGQFQQRLAPLQQLVNAQGDRVPAASAFPHLLRQVTDIARDSDLDLVSVAPEPAAPQGSYLVCDVVFEAHGHSLSLVRFLDRLAQDNPYQSLVACSINRHAASPERTCELAWVVRLYMMPTTTAALPEKRP